MLSEQQSKCYMSEYWFLCSMWQMWSQVRYTRQVETQEHSHLCTGQIPTDHTTLRSLSALIASLPASENKGFRDEFNTVCTFSTSHPPLSIICLVLTLPPTPTHSDTPYRSMKTSSSLRFSRLLRNRQIFWMMWVISNCQFPDSVLINMGACHVACR
jgi:hypothetical protein